MIKALFMPVNTKKMAVLDQLRQESLAVSLPQLMQKLPFSCSERTLRRWLADMVKAGFIDKLGNKRGSKYKAKNLTLPEASPFSTPSAKVITLVRRPLYERNPISYETEWLEAYEPNVSYYMPRHIQLELYHTGKRTESDEPAGTYAHQILNRLLIDLSYHSSRLEGNTYSLLETEKLILEGKAAHDKLDVEKIMILNHKEAIRYLVDTASKLAITEQTILTLHYLLSEGLIAIHDSGRIRNYGVRIGGSTYIPFENPERLQTILNSVLSKGAAITNPYEQSLFLLVHLSYLQAFADVNKRTARLSANIPLIKNNLVPLSFSDVSRDDYNSAMIAVYELQNTQPILDLYVFSYLKTCKLYDATVKAVGVDEIRVRYRQQRRAVIREIILKKWVGNDMTHYIKTASNTLVAPNDYDSFVEDVLEDLQELNQNRIVGLGITMDDLNAWIIKKSQSQGQI
jgi:hypothetical protein